MRKSFAAVAVVTLAVTLTLAAAPDASAAARTQKQTTTAKQQTREPEEPKTISAIFRRIARKLLPIGTTEETIWPTIPTP
jgi:hypothetical protein